MLLLKFGVSLLSYTYMKAVIKTMVVIHFYEAKSHHGFKTTCHFFTTL